jgi:GNAT superfamily N-acetyltransferase
VHRLQTKDISMTKATAPIQIRPAALADAAALAVLSTQLGYPLDQATMRARIERVREQCAGEVFVAEDGGNRALGWTHVVPRLHLEEAPFAELAGLIVADGARGGGVGARLLASAEDWARNHGYAQLRVRSNVVRERAHRFYLREGYIERKRQVVFDKAL